jgi:YfiH family protein
MASLKQIHSAVALVAGPSTGCAGEGDALITAQPGLALSVRTADCLPVLLADTVHRAVAAVHAGWRGTAAGVVVEALRQLKVVSGAEPAHVFAAIGPGIGACCYEVGDEVARRFGLHGTIHLDLAAENLRQLIKAGLPREQIDILGFCTACDAQRFYSWRRDREREGRMISFIKIAKPVGETAQ